MSSRKIGSPSGTAERYPPVGVLVDRAGLVLRAPLTDRIGEGEAAQPGRSGGQHAVQRRDGRGHVVGRVPGEKSACPQQVEPRRLLGAIGGQFVVQRPGEQAEFVAQAHVVTGQIARSGRQIMRGDRGEAVLAPAFGR